MNKLERIFNPRSVAVVGSKQADNYGWLKTFLPFQGPKYSINVDRNEWAGAEALGFPGYASVLDVPGEIDFVVISVPAQIVPRVLRDCIAKKVAGVHLFTAGFGETGTEEGIRLGQEIESMAKEAGLNLVGPNCLGVYNPKIGVGVNLGGGYYGEAGNFAVISQSGSQTMGLTRGAMAHGITISKAVSMGNGIILDSPDYLEYYAQDEDTHAIGMYLEGVRDGRRFFTTLRDVCAKKPVLVWKVGETEDAARAVASHSTSGTSEATVWDALVHQAGAIKVDSGDELIEVTKLLLRMPPTGGSRLALLALSGGHATEMANVFSKEGFSVPTLTEESYKRILEKFDLVGGSYRNPIEGRTMFNDESMNNVLDALNEDKNTDIIVHEVKVDVQGGAPSLYRRHGVDFFSDFRARAKKPYVMALDTAEFPQAEPEASVDVYRQLTEAGIPTLFGLQRTAAALRKVVDYYRYRTL